MHTFLTSNFRSIYILVTVLLKLNWYAHLSVTDRSTNRIHWFYEFHDKSRFWSEIDLHDILPFTLSFVFRCYLYFSLLFPFLASLPSSRLFFTSSAGFPLRAHTRSEFSFPSLPIINPRIMSTVVHLLWLLEDQSLFISDKVDIAQLKLEIILDFWIDSD